MKNFLKNNIFLFLVILLSIPAIIALFHFGFYGASDDLHIAWLYEMNKIISIGQIPPRFVADLSFGFGYPLFNFVFPLPYYIGSLVHLFGFSFVDCIKIVFGFSLMGSGVAMYFLLKEMLPGLLSLAGALIYIYTPYRSTDVYSRGAIGESLAFVFLPVLVMGAVKLFKSSEESKKINWKNISLISLSLAALILSHDIVAYMFFPFFLIFIVFLVFLSKNKKILFVNSLLGILGGLFISAYFWIPAIIESKLMTYGTVFNFVDHFPTIRQLLTSYFGYGASVAGPYDLMSFFMGGLNWFLLIVGGILAIVFWRKILKIEKGILIWASITFVISFFMMNFRSSFLWEHLPFLPYFQFPWRFLTMTTLTTVVFIIPFKYLNFKHFSYVIPGLFIILSIILNFNYFKPHDYLKRVDSYYLNKYIPVPVASDEYLMTQEEYLRLPKDSEKRPDKIYPLIFSDKSLSYEVLQTNGIYSKINIDLDKETEISYAKYNFPGWTAKIDGKKVKTTIGKPFGQVLVVVPAGKHILEFNFGETWGRMIIDIISLVSLVGLLVLSFKKTK